MLKSTNAYQLRQQEPNTVSNLPTASSLKPADGEVAPANPEARTEAVRVRRRKTAKRPSANEAASKVAPPSFPKLPFAFADQNLTDAVYSNMGNACLSRSDGLDDASFKS